jgi:hypothetical protein
MLKRIGTIALMLSALGAAALPQVALAQDGYYGRRDPHYDRRDRDWSRYQKREWRENERRERRADAWRRQEWREHEWRENRRWYDRCERPYYPGAYFGFDFRR